MGRFIEKERWGNMAGNARSASVAIPPRRLFSRLARRCSLCQSLALPAGILAIALIAGCKGPRSQFESKSPPIPQTTTATNLVAVAATSQFDSAWRQSPTNPFTLGPGDKLEIEILGDTNTLTRVTVGPDGRIYFYLLPGLDVWGLTLPQTRELMEQELQKYVREKQPVALTLRGVESKRVWLLGRLNNPGIYPMTGPMTLLEAIAQAGGPASASAFASLGAALGLGISGSTDEAADLRRSFVIRQGRMLPVDFHRLLREGDLSQNIYLQPDDFVYLPSAAAQEVHVLGAVAGPRAVNFVNELTLVAAIANAGGTIKDAYLSQVAIVRGSLTEPKIAIVDYRDVVRGKAPDVMLEPRDIVYVPFSPYRTLTRYADMVLQTFVRTVGVNEGARAAGGVGEVGVAVPVGP